MNKDEQKLMSLYGITQTSKTMFAYKQNKYENVQDAIKFAESDRKHGHEKAVPDAE